ncbi:hypothetical protein [Dyella sedimenti]|uniref:hypothetical protein n=1 Tax=Dyella sedimenti TaxID=2919947 RepID=UPI001FAB18F2|nr:hypothetical protein [Dyella sedimenti]
MKRYRNLSGNSGVAGFESGEGFIRVRFVDDGTYEYTDDTPGHLHVKNMQALAEAGLGLATYISRFVRERYARKLD